MVASAPFLGLFFYDFYVCADHFLAFETVGTGGGCVFGLSICCVAIYGDESEGFACV